MKYKYLFLTNESCSVEVSTEFYVHLTESDKAQAANDKYHTRSDRKHQHGKRPVSLNEIPDIDDGESWCPGFSEVIQGTANHETGEKVLIEKEERRNHKDLIRRMLAALDALPPKRQDIIRCVYLHNEKPKDYAKRTGCTFQYVYKERDKALKQLFIILSVTED